MYLNNLKGTSSLPVNFCLEKLLSKINHRQLYLTVSNLKCTLGKEEGGGVIASRGSGMGLRGHAPLNILCFRMPQLSFRSFKLYSATVIKLSPRLLTIILGLYRNIFSSSQLWPMVCSIVFYWWLLQESFRPVMRFICSPNNLLADCSRPDLKKSGYAAPIASNSCWSRGPIGQIGCKFDYMTYPNYLVLQTWGSNVKMQGPGWVREKNSVIESLVCGCGLFPSVCTLVGLWCRDIRSFSG